MLVFKLDVGSVVGTGQNHAYRDLIGQVVADPRIEEREGAVDGCELEPRHELAAVVAVLDPAVHKLGHAFHERQHAQEQSAGKR